MKLKTIKLSDGHDMINPREPVQYRVEQLTNSIDYRIGQFLDKDEVKGLCRSANWKVTIVGNSRR